MVSTSPQPLKGNSEAKTLWKLQMFKFGTNSYSSKTCLEPIQSPDVSPLVRLFKTFAEI